MKSRAAIAQYEATVVLVVVSLSLAAVVYSGLRREANLSPQPIFVNEKTSIGGTPDIERVEVNASSQATLSSLSIDEASSTAGILDFDGSVYATSTSLCAAGVTTFFSVLATQSGTLQVSTSGRAWIDGAWGGSASVTAGWQEVMIQSGSSCTVTLPGGQVVPSQWSPSSRSIASIPAANAMSGSAFVFFFPIGGGSHRMLLTSNGGFDDVSL